MELAQLSQARQAYERASNLDVTASAHIERVAGQHVQATKVIRRAVSAEIVEARSMFKNAHNARQAVIASMVLGPPRALEQGRAMFEA